MLIKVTRSQARTIFIQWLASKDLLIDWLDATNLHSDATVALHGERGEDSWYDEILSMGDPYNLINEAFGFAIDEADPDQDKWNAISLAWQEFMRLNLELSD